MIRQSILFALLVLITPIAVHADSLTEIQNTVNAYFEGTGTADLDLLKKAFVEDQATMVGLVRDASGQ